MKTSAYTASVQCQSSQSVSVSLCCSRFQLCVCCIRFFIIVYVLSLTTSQSPPSVTATTQYCIVITDLPYRQCSQPSVAAYKQQN